ncbi:MAG: type II toxin-antitoxin system ParD family antitoxin [Defluviicoccus sp.]|nr:type II toxin-antitoxin system ParD family antitoxin [Defluviicoccus sp.]
MPTRNVVLSDHQASLIARLVGSGRYQNASEVMRAGLRLIERHEAEEEIRLKAMREAVDEGIADIAAGRYRTFETPEALRDGLAAIVDEALGEETAEGGV